MKALERYEPIARRLADGLKDDERAIFLRGCHVDSGAEAEVDHALEVAAERLSWLDPRPHLAQVRTAVHVVHGADDDVIPVRHVDGLAEGCTSASSVHRWVTGMYGHTGPAGLAGLLGRGPAAVREVHTMIGLLRAIVAVAHPSSSH
jgi:pimeloyl-ACP methyl ester carboxylesterase